MSSEMARFVLSSLTYSGTPGRRRLHSRSHALFSRMFSTMLCGGACQLVADQIVPAAQAANWSALAELIALLIAILAVARSIWVRPKPVYATKSGLEIGAGKKCRLIPWSRVRDVREMPSVRFRPFANPSLWQVDLDRGQSLDFCGTSQAREIVAEYMARA